MGLDAKDFAKLGKSAQRQILSQLMETKQVKKSPSKYKAERVSSFLIDGTPFTFASKKEFSRYQELALLERAGEISDLKVQVPFELVPSQKDSDGKTIRPVIYIADFTYRKDGELVVEDVKGYKNPASAAYRVFQIKKKLMKWIHKIEVHEV